MPVARKDHGPCDQCGLVISPGEPYLQTWRPVRPGEQPDGSLPGWVTGYRPSVRIKRHTNPRHRDLRKLATHVEPPADSYTQAFDEWYATEDAELWDNTVGDGL